MYYFKKKREINYYKKKIKEIGGCWSRQDIMRCWLEEE